MSLDAALKELPALRDMLEQILEQQALILDIVRPTEKAARTSYKYQDLRDEGYAHHEARRVLRAYGNKQGSGPYRVSRQALAAYAAGEPAPE